MEGRKITAGETNYPTSTKIQYGQFIPRVDEKVRSKPLIAGQ